MRRLAYPPRCAIVLTEEIDDMGKRSFHGKRKGVPFTHVTKLTNAQAIAKLNARGGSFESDCAFEIGKLACAGARVKSSLVAWGFRLADEKKKRAKPHAAVVLPDGAMTARKQKPVDYLTPLGSPIKIRLAGANSKHYGNFLITSGHAFGDPAGVFYGVCDPAGNWKPTAKTPKGIVSYLKGL
jgi:hypothetical protein